MPVTRREVAGAVIASLLLGALALALRPRVAPDMADLEVYWTAASRAAAGEPLFRAADGHYQFKYLPAFAVLIAPLGAVAWPAAQTIWFTLSAMLIPALVCGSLALLPDRRTRPWLVVTGTTVVLAKFLGHELVLGQVNILFGVVAIAALLALRRGQEALGGGLISLAIVIKPYAVIFLPWLVARRRAPSILAAAIGLGLVLLLPAVWYGLDGTIDLHRDWWRTVADSTAPNLTNNDNVSVAGLFAKWIGPGTLAAALAFAANALLLATVLVVYRWRDAVGWPEGLEGALLLTCIPLISPQGWDYVFLISAPAVAFVITHQRELPPLLRWAALVALATIGFSLFDVMGREAYAAFMQMSIITICYLIVVAALAALRLRGAA